MLSMKKGGAKEKTEISKVTDDLSRKKFLKKIYAAIIVFSSFIIIVLAIFFVYSQTNPNLRPLTFGAEIERAFLSANNQDLYIKLKGGVSSGEITGVKFIFKSTEQEYFYETSEGAKEISVPFKKSWVNLLIKPNLEGVYDYSISSSIIGLDNFDNIDEISVLLKYKAGEGTLLETKPLDTKKPANKTIGRSSNRSGGGRGGSSGGGGGGGGGGGCTPSKSCSNYPGECRASLSDGCNNVLDCSLNCNSSQTCNSTSGMCIAIEPCSNDTGCSTSGISCEGNLNYNCTLKSDGCYDRINLTQCLSSQNCINGTGCLDIPECTADANCTSLRKECSSWACNLTSEKCQVSFNSSSAVCRPASGVCDAEETCTGSSETCPVDSSKSDGTLCLDSLFCNGQETCQAGTCQAGTAVSCSDSVSCTVDSCNETSDSCNHAINNNLCLDGLFCNGQETCNALLGCQAGTSPNCNDEISCSIDTCAEGADLTDNVGNCLNNMANCPCNIDLDCDDSNSCTDDVCTAQKTCQNTANNSRTCTDGFYCTINERCSSGSCISDNRDVNDGISCTTDSCDEATDSIEHIADNGYCNDENICTNDVCNVLTGCQNTFNTLSCNDNLYCTVNDACSLGICSGSSRDCSSLSSQCDLGQCSEAADTCFANPVPKNGNSCTDTISCTENDVCSSGTCSGTPNSGLCQSWESCVIGTGCSQTSCSGCSNCDGWFDPCSYNECHNQCQVSETCYYRGIIPLASDCVTLSYACSILVSSCSDYSQLECANDNCDIAPSVNGCLWNSASSSCQPAPYCGDGTCSGTETCSNCAADCGCSGGTPFCSAGACVQCLSDSNCDYLDTACGYGVCNVGTCQLSYNSSSNVCRTSAGECDLAETCTGASATCPTNSFKPDGTSCTGGICSSGVCVNPGQKLIAFYPFEDNANDASGNGNNGVVSGATFISGKIGKATSFNRESSNYVRVANSPIFNTNQITLSTWINPNRIFSWDRIISKYFWTATGITGSWIILIDDLNRTICSINVNGVFVEVTSSTSLISNQWNYVACVYDGSNIRLYNNLNSVSASTAGTISSSSNPIGIATSSDGTSYQNYFNGLIDEVKIWNYALTLQEITNEYNRVGTGDTVYLDVTTEKDSYAPNEIIYLTGRGALPSQNFIGRVVNFFKDLYSTVTGKAVAKITGHDIYGGSGYSIINNSGTSAITGYLRIEVQNSLGGLYQVISDDSILKTITPGSYLDLNDFWPNDFSISTPGGYKVYAKFYNSSGVIKIGSRYLNNSDNFAVTGCLNDNDCNYLDDACGYGVCTASSCQLNYNSSSTVCRASAGECDLQETCTGSSGACPANSYKPAGTACSGGGVCNGAGTCVVAGSCTNPATDVVINSGDNITAIVNAHPAGTSYLIKAGLYRMYTAYPKTGDKFYGELAPDCTRLTTMSGAKVLTNFVREGNYYVATGQKQENYFLNDARYCQRGDRCLRPEDLFFDNVPLEHVGSLNELGPRKYYFDYANDKIYFVDDPTGHVVETSVIQKAFQSKYINADNVLIKGFIIEKYASTFDNGGSAIWPIPPGGNWPQYSKSKNWVVDFNEIRLNHGVGIYMTINMKVTNNYMHHNGQQAVYSWGDDNGVPNLLVEGNEISYNSWANVSIFWARGGSKIGESRNLTVRNNCIHDNLGSGFWTDYHNFGTLYEYNVIFGNPLHGIFHEVSGNATIRKNLIGNNGFGTIAEGYPGGDWGWIWHSNIQINSKDVDIYNNYVVVNESYGNAIGIIWENRADVSGHAGNNNHVHNNEVVFLRPSGYGKIGATSGGGQPYDQVYTQNKVDYNTYHMRNINDIHFLWNGATNFAGFQAKGQDVHGTADTNIVPRITNWSCNLSPKAFFG